jgi:hypothetical protein
LVCLMIKLNIYIWDVNCPLIQRSPGSFKLNTTIVTIMVVTSTQYSQWFEQVLPGTHSAIISTMEVCTLDYTLDTTFSRSQTQRLPSDTSADRMTYLCRKNGTRYFWLGVRHTDKDIVQYQSPNGMLLHRKVLSQPHGSSFVTCVFSYLFRCCISPAAFD